MSPMEYAMKLEKEMMFGNSSDKIIKNNTDDYEEDEFSDDYLYAKNYSFYAYPDYQCKEYEASVIRDTVNILTSNCYDKEDIQKKYGGEIVIILIQG